MPSDDETYTDAVILDMLDAVIHTEGVPSILGLKSDYWKTYEDIAVTANRTKYPIPTRSSLNRIFEVEYLNSDKTDKQTLEYKHQRDMDPSSTGEPYAHDLRDDCVLVYPKPSSTTGYIRIHYHYIPSNLVATTACMEITGGVDTGVLTGSAVTGWTTALSYDIVAAESPFSLIHAGLTASAVSAGVSITFTLTDLDTNRLGTGTYYVTQAKQTCFPMLPQSLHYTACDLVVARIREETGDEGFGQKMGMSSETLRKQTNAIFPRKETENKPSVHRKSLYRYF